MVALRKNEITSVPLSEIAGKINLVNPENGMVVKAKNMGTSFGD